MEGHKKPGHGAHLMLAVTIASCADNRLPPNPVPNPEVRREIPGWFDPNAKWDPKGNDTRVYIEGKIVFAVDKAIIKPESEEVLQKLLAFLQAHPEITRLRIEGHTDSDASDEHNQELSAKRSLAVCDWLVDRGIDYLRLVAVGFGEKKPIAPNEEKAGKAENRRTEFHVMEVEGRPFGPASALDGGMVLTVLSAEERARLKNPPKHEFKKPPPFEPKGNEIKQVKAAPKKAVDEEIIVQAPGGDSTPTGVIAAPPGAAPPPPPPAAPPGAPPPK